MSGLTKQEQLILGTFEKAFRYLTEEEKRNLYYFGLGLVLNGRKNNNVESSNKKA